MDAAPATAVGFASASYQTVSLMSAATDDPERRARIDLMLLDIELRIEQIAATRGSIGSNRDRRS